MRNTRWGIFISGRGSNLQTILDWDDRVDVGLVVSSKKSALGLRKARRAGKKISLIKNPVDWQKLQNVLIGNKIQKIFLLGFMKIIPEALVNSWKGNLYNVHPSLLPKHPGMHGLEDGWKEGGPLGVTVHHVIFEMDAGQKIFQGSYSKAKSEWTNIVRRNAWMERRLVSEVVCR